MTEWLLDCEPRAAQLEATSRSWNGVRNHDRWDAPLVPTPILGRTGDPAKGWAHFLEMRVGKTPTMLNEFALMRKYYNSKWMIVPAPQKFKKDWPLAIEQFGAHGFEGHAIDSNKLRNFKSFVDKNKKTGGLIAVNYEALRSRNVMAELMELMPEIVVFAADESVLIKGHDSLITKAAIEIAKLSQFRRVLTGKPVVQGPHDLWSQLRAIGELNGVNFFAFKSKFCKMGGYMGKIVKGLDPDQKDNFEAILDACSFRARKIDWMPNYLRPEYVEAREIEMTPEQRDMYTVMERDSLVQLGEGDVISPDMVISKLQKLQQISSGYVKRDDGTNFEIIPPSRNPKLNELKEMLANEITGKLIVFCESNYSLDLLYSELKEYQPAIIRGDLWHKKNGVDVLSEKARFNESLGCRVMIGQEKAIKYGHTLMGNANDACLDSIFYENSYSLDDRSQCEERNQGFGQLAQTSIHDFVCSPIERRIIENGLRPKEDISAAVMGYARETGVLPYASTSEPSGD